MSMEWEYNRDPEWDTFSIKEKLDDIVSRLMFVSNKEVYRELRSRYASEKALEEEFGPNSGFQKYLSELWFGAKEDYCRYKEHFDTYLELNPQGESYMININAMRKVIDEEIDAMLLENLTESNNDEKQENS